MMIMHDRICFLTSSSSSPHWTFVNRDGLDISTFTGSSTADVSPSIISHTTPSALQSNASYTITVGNSSIVPGAATETTPQPTRIMTTSSAPDVLEGERTSPETLPDVTEGGSGSTAASGTYTSPNTTDQTPTSSPHTTKDKKGNVTLRMLLLSLCFTWIIMKYNVKN